MYNYKVCYLDCITYVQQIYINVYMIFFLFTISCDQEVRLYDTLCNIEAVFA